MKNPPPPKHRPLSTIIIRKKHTHTQNIQANWRRDVIAAVVFVCRPTFCRKESKKHTIIPTTKNWPSAVGHANRKVGHSSDTRHDSKQIRIDVTWRDAFLSSAKTPQKSNDDTDTIKRVEIRRHTPTISQLSASLSINREKKSRVHQTPNTFMRILIKREREKE